MNAIADTGFLVAFGNRNDLHHQWAVDLAHRVVEPLLTCEAVLAETAFRISPISGYTGATGAKSFRSFIRRRNR